jgi:hypothetical protein
MEMLRTSVLIFLMLFPALAASGQNLTASFPPGYGPAETITVPPNLFPAVNGSAVTVVLKDGRTSVKIKDFPRPEKSSGFEYQATLYSFLDSRNVATHISIGGINRDDMYRITIVLGLGRDADVFNEVRIESEAKLKEILGLSEAQLCFLNISEHTSEFSVPEEFPNGLGLSFCAGAVTKEQIQAAIQSRR